MSNQELDNLFKTKLEELERKPSANAWERIQAGKQQKKGKSIWLYSGIAATVTLLIAFAGIFLLNNENTITTADLASLDGDIKHKEISVQTEQSIAASKDEKESQSLQKPESSLQMTADSGQNVQHEKTNIDKDNKKNLIAQSSQINSKKTANKKANTENLSESGTGKPKTNTGELKPEKEEQDTELKNLDVDATNTTTVASTNKQPDIKDKGQTITFNIEDFTATTSVAKAEEKDEKKSPLKKVMNFAKTLKEGDGGLGELREAKNELFALNFKKENDNSK